MANAKQLLLLIQHVGSAMDIYESQREHCLEMNYLCLHLNIHIAYFSSLKSGEISTKIILCLVTL